MQIKSFYEEWTNQEIVEYIHSFNVLVLFGRESTGLKIKIYGDMSEKNKEQLKFRIMDTLGRQLLSDDVCDKINEFAGRWYNKVILGKTYRVVNKTGRSA